MTGRAAHGSNLLGSLRLRFSEWNTPRATREILKAREACGLRCVVTVLFVKREIIQVEISENREKVTSVL